jgi:uncharacterized repeat protein (TIGR03803 family)
MSNGKATNLTALAGTICRLITVGTITIVALTNAWAGQKTLHSFAGGKDGANPHGNLIADSAGNLYGTTELGGEKGKYCGTTGCGIVFEEVKNSDGAYQERVLYRFQGGKDGNTPWSGLTLDAEGNLYGTTLAGGGSRNCEKACGTVFKLTKGSTGLWTETVLYAFQGGLSDGQSPGGQLLFDSQGNLYGTTFYGAIGGCFEIGCGSVFKLTPGTDGSWTETLLYAFTGGADGGEPSGALSQDSSGNLYGTTEMGGGPLAGGGTVFELSPSAGGTWSLSTLFNFVATTDSETGEYPIGGVILDSAGNLYGTTECGGYTVLPTGWSPCTYGFGAVFKLSRGVKGVWNEEVIYKFAGIADAAYADTPLLFDSAGNLYGTTFYGGEPNGVGGGGTAFELTRESDGTWTENVLSRFLGDTPNSGITPYAGVLRDSTGNLFGTTWGRGELGYGVVYEVTP